MTEIGALHYQNDLAAKYLSKKTNVNDLDALCYELINYYMLLK